MKTLKNNWELISILFIVSFSMILGCVIGAVGQGMANEMLTLQPRERAMNIGIKECYTNQDLEIIIFGEIQE